jgi:NAD(P)-dependent dehydrogenase (short-subunit alcohol dehydrogenase family)
MFGGGDHPAPDPKPTGDVANLLDVALVEVDDVTAAVAFLASDEARYITGVALPVDAGMLVR